MKECQILLPPPNNVSFLNKPNKVILFLKNFKKL
jgi:hypothetical protein